MALCKEIDLGKGVKANYHRIKSMVIIVNQEIQILVSSYTDKQQREEEKVPVEEGQEPIFNSIFNEVIYAPYTEDFNVKEAYEYLKTTDKYKDAEDC